MRNVDDADGVPWSLSGRNELFASRPLVEVGAEVVLEAVESSVEQYGNLMLVTEACKCGDFVDAGLFARAGRKQSQNVSRTA